MVPKFLVTWSVQTITWLKPFDHMTSANNWSHDQRVGGTYFIGDDSYKSKDAADGNDQYHPPIYKQVQFLSQHSKLLTAATRHSGQWVRHNDHPRQTPTFQVQRVPVTIIIIGCTIWQRHVFFVAMVCERHRVTMTTAWLTRRQALFVW